MPAFRLLADQGDSNTEKVVVEEGQGVSRPIPATKGQGICAGSLGQANSAGRVKNRQTENQVDELSDCFERIRLA